MTTSVVRWLYRLCNVNCYGVVRSCVRCLIGNISSFCLQHAYDFTKYLQASECEIVWVMRVAALFFATIATIMAIFTESIYGLFVLCGDFVYVLLFSQLLLVVYVDWINTYGSFIGKLRKLQINFNSLRNSIDQSNSKNPNGRPRLHVRKIH